MTDAAPRPALPLDRTTVGLGALLAALATLTTWDQWATWSTKDDYTFGYLVPVFAAYVLWDRWADIRALLTGERGFVSAPSHPWVVRLAGLAAFGALLGFVGGAAARIMYGTGAAATTRAVPATFGSVDAANVPSPGIETSRSARPVIVENILR